LGRYLRSYSETAEEFPSEKVPAAKRPPVDRPLKHRTDDMSLPRFKTFLFAVTQSAKVVVTAAIEITVVGMCGTWSTSLVWLGVLIDMAATDVNKLTGRPGRCGEGS
jgi:hypothetical protein